MFLCNRHTLGSQQSTNTQAEQLEVLGRKSSHQEVRINMNYVQCNLIIHIIYMCISVAKFKVFEVELKRSLKQQ